MSAGVIFDLDGVIVDTEELWAESWTDFCGRRGGRWSAEDTARVQGMSSREWSRDIAGHLGGGATADQVRQACTDYTISAIRSGRGPLLDGARELIIATSQAVPLAVASSAPRQVIEAVLELHELAGQFRATVSSDDVESGKPSPDVYRAAAQAISVPASDAIAIEDSGNGILAAHRAGMRVVALPNPAFPPTPDMLRLADHVATSHDDAGRYILPLVGGTHTSGRTAR